MNLKENLNKVITEKEVDGFSTEKAFSELYEEVATVSLGVGIAAALISLCVGLVASFSIAGRISRKLRNKKVAKAIDESPEAKNIAIELKSELAKPKKEWDKSKISSLLSELDLLADKLEKERKYNLNHEILKSKGLEESITLTSVALLSTLTFLSGLIAIDNKTIDSIEEAMGDPVIVNKINSSPKASEISDKIRAESIKDNPDKEVIEKLLNELKAVIDNFKSEKDQVKRASMLNKNELKKLEEETLEEDLPNWVKRYLE